MRPGSDLQPAVSLVVIFPGDHTLKRCLVSFNLFLVGVNVLLLLYYYIKHIQYHITIHLELIIYTAQKRPVKLLKIN